VIKREGRRQGGGWRPAMEEEGRLVHTTAEEGEASREGSCDL